MESNAIRHLAESAGLPPAQWLPELLELQAELLRDKPDRLEEGLRALRAMVMWEREMRADDFYIPDERRAIERMHYPQTNALWSLPHLDLAQRIVNKAASLGVASPFCTCWSCNERFERSCTEAMRQVSEPRRRLVYVSRSLCKRQRTGAEPPEMLELQAKRLRDKADRLEDGIRGLRALVMEECAMRADAPWTLQHRALVQSIIEKSASLGMGAFYCPGPGLFCKERFEHSCAEAMRQANDPSAVLAAIPGSGKVSSVAAEPATEPSSPQGPRPDPHAREELEESWYWYTTEEPSSCPLS
jgi:hypothetical protein